MASAQTLDDLTHVWLEAALFPQTLALFPAHVTVLKPEPEPMPPYTRAQPAQVLIASSRVAYGPTMMDALPHLRMIARTGIGVDNVDVAAATAHGIVVTNTPDGPTQSTAEHTVAMLLALAARLKQGNANLASGQFGPRTGILVGTEVMGKTLGLIGLGRIGRRVAEICRLGLRMNVVGCDPYVTADQAAAMGVTLVELDHVVAQADFLSLHVPATPATTGMVDAGFLAQMKAGAVLLNMARGALIDADALLDALDRQHLAGVGLDVFEPEPPAPDSRLRDHPNVIATPHIASLTLDGRLRMEQMAVERVLAYFSGERPADVVNPSLFEESR